MPDFGLYTGLLASPNYQVRRQDAAQNIILAKQMRDDAVAQMQERMKSMGVISEYLNKSAEVQNELLPQDAERVKQKDLKLREGFISRLQEVNNDPVMFRMMGGDAEMDKYARDLSGSEELKTGLTNKKNYTAGAAALMKGDFIYDVEVEFAGGTKSKLPYVEALDLFNQGIIKKLPFVGSGELASIDPTDYLKIETPDADLKHKGFVGLQFIADSIQANNPHLHLTDEQALQQARVYANPDVKGASKFLWGRRLPHTSGGGVGWANRQDRIMSAKNAIDMLHKGLFDKNVRGEYNQAANGYSVLNSPIDLSKIRESSDTHSAPAEGLYVRPDPTDASKSVYIITFEGGGKKEMNVDDLLRSYPPPGVSSEDITALNMTVNNDGSALYNPYKWQRTLPPETPFGGSTQDKSAALGTPPDFIKNNPNLLKAWKDRQRGSQKNFSYWNNTNTPTVEDNKYYDDLLKSLEQ